MEKLTNKQIINICDSVIKEMTAAKKTRQRQYLEILIKREIIKIQYHELHDINIADYIKEYTLQNALIMANAEPDEVDGSLWWNGSVYHFDYDNRIQFMQFIKECYQNK